MSSVQSLLVELDAVPLRSADAWRAQLAMRLEEGDRVVTLFARSDDEQHVVLTAVLEDASGALTVERARIVTAHGYHELTSTFVALHCFEREMHEQTGLRIAGHAWLKPIRFEGFVQTSNEKGFVQTSKEKGAARAAMDAFPWFQVQGKEVHEVAVGPIHAGVIEPGAFRFMCLGEQVQHLEIHLGYQHRGIEPRLLASDPRRLTPLIETVAGDTSVAHAWASCAALEALGGIELAPQTDFARAVMLELERVAMHLAGLSGLAADIGFLQGATTYGRLRTTAINTSMRLCGSRFGRGAIRPGGLGADFSGGLSAAREGVALLVKDLALINAHFLDARTVRHRLEGAGVLSRADALSLGVVGMAARASGITLDSRRHATGIWKDAPLPVVVLSEGDCHARAKLRIDEMTHSLNWLAATLEARLSVPATPRHVVGPLAPNRLAVSMVEGWRGEVVHVLETNASGTLSHYKLQDPSLRNWMGLAIAVRGNEISDFPICNKSFDLSYCGNDL